MDLNRGIFLVVNQLQASYQALEASLQFIKKHGGETQAEAASKRLGSIRPLKGMACDWADRFWKEGSSEGLIQDLMRLSKKLLETMNQELNDEAARLEAILQFSRLPGSAETVEMLASMSRQAHRDELLLRGCVTLSKRGDTAPLAQATQGHEDPEPRLLALRHFEKILESGEPWDEWDLMSLRARILTLPELMRHDALEAGLLSDTLESGAPELTEEARQAWGESGFKPEEGAAWLGARFMPEEAQQWKKAGIELAAQALDWSAMSVDPPQAVQWWAQGFLPEEARCYMAAGVESAEEAARVRKAFGNFENLRPWIRAGFSLADSLMWKEKGARNADQAAALRERRQKVPAEAAPEPEAPPAPSVPEVAAPGGPALIFWGRIFKKAPEGVDLPALPSGTCYVAAKDSLQRCGKAEAIKAPEMLLEWRDEVDAACKAANLDAAAQGAFYLACAEAGMPATARVSAFWGADFGPSQAPPWAGSMDHMPSESWLARFRRKVDEWGESGDLHMVMGRGPGGSWLAMLKESLTQSEDGDAQALEHFDAHKAWRDHFEDFSRIMDLPLKRPRWMLGLVEVSEEPPASAGASA